MSKKSRVERLMPEGIPRYVRIYDNQGKSFDRYTVVFSRTGRSGSNRHKSQNGSHIYMAMSEYPYHPQGFCQHGESKSVIDCPSYGHLGKKIKFVDLPEGCRKAVVEDYMDIWNINP